MTSLHLRCYLMLFCNCGDLSQGVFSSPKPPVTPILLWNAVNAPEPFLGEFGHGNVFSGVV